MVWFFQVLNFMQLLTQGTKIFIILIWCRIWQNRHHVLLAQHPALTNENRKFKCSFTFSYFGSWRSDNYLMISEHLKIRVILRSKFWIAKEFSKFVEISWKLNFGANLKKSPHYKAKKVKFERNKTLFGIETFDTSRQDVKCRE